MGTREALGSQQYRLAWTDAASQMRKLSLPGTGFSYAFAERDAKAIFDRFWLTLGTTVYECICRAVAQVQDEAKRVSSRNADDAKGERNDG